MIIEKQMLHIHATPDDVQSGSSPFDRCPMNRNHCRLVYLLLSLSAIEMNESI